MVCLGQYFQHISYHPPLSNAAERRLSARAWAPSQAQLPAFKFRQEPELHCGSRPPRRALQPAGGGACLGEPGHARPESVSENRRHPSPSAPPEQRAVWTARGSVPPPGAPGAGPGGSAGAQEAGMRSTATGARSLFAGSAGGSDAGPLPGRAAAAASHARPCRKTVAIRVPRRPRRHRPRSAPGAAAMRQARALPRRPEAPPPVLALAPLSDWDSGQLGPFGLGHRLRPGLGHDDPKLPPSRGELSSARTRKDAAGRPAAAPPTRPSSRARVAGGAYTNAYILPSPTGRISASA